jgi:hypothetical protein
MSYYVKRNQPAGPSGAARDGWTGPIRSRVQAEKEVTAWLVAGWIAHIVESTPAVRREVRDWQLAADVRHGRRPTTPRA